MTTAQINHYSEEIVSQMGNDERESFGDGSTWRDRIRAFGIRSDEDLDRLLSRIASDISKS